MSEIENSKKVIRGYCLAILISLLIWACGIYSFVRIIMEILK
jgi:hypothetical protein